MNAATALTDEDLRRDFGISHRSIFETLLHMAGAEWIWLERWNGRSPAKDEAWPRWSAGSCADHVELHRRWTEHVDQRDQYLEHLDGSTLEADLPFRLLSGYLCSMRLF